MNEEELSPAMKKALIQIGYGVFARVGGWFDENGDRVSLRAINALLRCGLVDSVGGTKVGFIVREVGLTDAGEQLFELLRNGEP